MAAMGRRPRTAAVQQMEKACALPVAVAGALMPDAHVGYGLPIGGVLATENAVIPYAVGVDIACRMKLTVLDLSGHAHCGQAGTAYARIIERETRFGMGANSSSAASTRCWTRIGRVAGHRTNKRPGLVATRHQRQRKSFRRVRRCSRSTTDRLDRRCAPGEYVALLTPQRHPRHGRAGLPIITASSRSASFPDLPKELKRLAWLSLDDRQARNIGRR